jgi:DNA helicase II / ATP-dependent DNA helicase PcrA
MRSEVLTNPAIEASEKALAELHESIAAGKSFLLEAGAGAGKTYSLIEVLKSQVKQHAVTFSRSGKRIACITFTNVAKDEIESRTDRNPIIHCDTIHGFCWSLISPYQRQMREIVPTLEAWRKRLADEPVPTATAVEYSLGYRGLNEHTFSLGHDDVIPLTVELMKNAKFRSFLTARYPIILIDEYQDTNAQWIQAIEQHFLGKPDAPLFGFFGDHWQKIYDEGCGAIHNAALQVIGKHANFRSVQTIVDCLNRMRPELVQFSKDPQSSGDVRLFHTNAWNAARKSGPHYGGDLPEELAAEAYETTKELLATSGWEFSSDRTKVLMLTHRALAREQGYSSLPQIFTYNEAFSKKENKLIEFLVGSLEPAIEAYNDKRFGAMFDSLGSKLPAIRSQGDKKLWADSISRLKVIREQGTVGEVVSHLRESSRPRLPDRVEEMERELERFRPSPELEMPRWMKELQLLHDVSYREIIALRGYHAGLSPFETNHGVKGAEFENVLVVVGRGWNKYNFSEMLEWATAPTAVPDKSRNKYEQNRNLFYVACSRPKVRLAILFTQLISQRALNTLESWFGSSRIESLPQG